MQVKETTIAELTSSLEEVNNILVAHIQKHYSFKIENVQIAKDGTITFTGQKSKDLTQAELSYNAAGGDDLAASILGVAKKGTHGGKRVTRNGGLNQFIRAQFKVGEDMNIDMLLDKVHDHGFKKVYRSSIISLVKGMTRNYVDKISDNVYRLKDGVQTEQFTTN